MRLRFVSAEYLEEIGGAKMRGLLEELADVIGLNLNRIEQAWQVAEEQRLERRREVAQRRQEAAQRRRNR